MSPRESTNRAVRFFATTFASATLFANIHAVTIPVTTLADDGAAGTLRAALASASDGDTIDATGVLGTIVLTAGELVVDKSVTILGPGPGNLTVDANHLSRVFHVTPNHTATIDSLAIVNGQASGNYPGNLGGGIYNDNSILTVSNCIVRNNDATISGGGIYNDGSDSGYATLIVLDSILSRNSAAAAGASYGGGITNDGSFFGNAALWISNCTLNDNSADHRGGGILNSGFNFGNATLTVVQSTLSGNSAYQRGGGVFNVGASFGSASLTVADSTLSGNSAHFGGGIYNDGFDLGVATLTLSASTLSDNTANQGYGGGIHNDGTGAFLGIGNTILKAGIQGDNIANFAGSTTSHGFNLSSDDGAGILTTTGDQINTNPLLGPLQDNGGPTLTHLPLPGSPAIDRGNRNAIPALATDTDQRGLARTVDDGAIPNAPFSDGTDIGAVEVPAVPVLIADLLVSLGVDKSSVKQGELLTYTITVRNFGPDAADNVEVNDALSSGTTFVSARANKGNFTAPPQNQSGVVTWNLGTLENGDIEGAKLTVTVIVKGKTTVTNVASAMSDTEDPNLANNVAAVTTSVAAGGGKKK